MRLQCFKPYREGYATRPDIQADTCWMAFKSMAIIPLDNHGWTYRLDGALVHARDAESDPGFCREAVSLLPVAVNQWAQCVFVNTDPDAARWRGTQ